MKSRDDMALRLALISTPAVTLVKDDTMADQTPGGVEIERYGYSSGLGISSFAPRHDGQWVHYSDHARIIAALAAENAALVADARRYRVMRNPPVYGVAPCGWLTTEDGDLASDTPILDDTLDAACDAALTRATEEAK